MQLMGRCIQPSLRAATLCVVALAVSGCAEAQTLSPYSDFQSMSLADMDSLRVKLTYVGPQDEIHPTLAFAVPGTAIRMDLFVPYRRPAFTYGNDNVGPVPSTASRQELKTIIDNVGTLPLVTVGGVARRSRVSFMLLSTAGGTTKAFESVVNDTIGRDVFAQVLQALANNTDGMQRVRRFGCDAAMLPTNIPTNVGSQTTATFSGLRADRAQAGRFVGRVRVTNNSGSTIQPPLIVAVIRKGGNAALLEATGETCNISPAGVPFIRLDVGSGLAPGASVEKVLRFENPSLMKFDVAFRVFAGSGTP